MPELYTLKEAAVILKVSLSKLYHMRKNGDLEFIPIGGRNKVAKEDLIQLIKSNAGKRLKERI